MRNAPRLFLAAGLILALGCASSGGKAAPQAASAPPRQATSQTRPLDQQISPAHPYCMNFKGRLRECVSFAFGRCQAFGGPCDRPGFATSAAASAPDAAAPPDAAGASSTGGAAP